ncbi:hypothetical protein ACQ2H7_003612 [Candidozyma auris]
MNSNFGDPEGASLSRRLSSNNPFRQFEAPRNRGSSVQSSNSAFEQWIEKNKALIEDSDEEREVFVRPSFPTSSRTGSDSDVNYGRKRKESNDLKIRITIPKRRRSGYYTEAMSSFVSGNTDMYSH